MTESSQSWNGLQLYSSIMWPSRSCNLYTFSHIETRCLTGLKLFHDAFSVHVDSMKLTTNFSFFFLFSRDWCRPTWWAWCSRNWRGRKCAPRRWCSAGTRSFASATASCVSCSASATCESHTSSLLTFAPRWSAHESRPKVNRCPTTSTNSRSAPATRFLLWFTMFSIQLTWRSYF